MKNIHILPTDKPSILVRHKNNLFIEKKPIYGEPEIQLEALSIHITSDSEIKEGDWSIVNGKPEQILKIQQAENVNYKTKTAWFTNCKKIILTTDQDLIKDGVQAIDDEFLEWFVKNPSCEEVKVEYLGTITSGIVGYKIIIPKEHPKQETLEEAAYNYAVTKTMRTSHLIGFREGAKWQQDMADKKYTEEDLRKAFEKGALYGSTKNGNTHYFDEVINSLNKQD